MHDKIKEHAKDLTDWMIWWAISDALESGGHQGQLAVYEDEGLADWLWGICDSGDEAETEGKVEAAKADLRELLLSQQKRHEAGKLRHEYHMSL